MLLVKYLVMDLISHTQTYLNYTTIQGFLRPHKKTNLTKSIKTVSGLQITPTRTQSGGFLGTLLASIGIPMVLKALTGNGMQVEPYRGNGMQVEPYRCGSKKNMMKYQSGKGLIIGNY